MTSYFIGPRGHILASCTEQHYSNPDAWRPVGVVSDEGGVSYFSGPAADLRMLLDKQPLTLGAEVVQ